MRCRAVGLGLVTAMTAVPVRAAGPTPVTAVVSAVAAQYVPGGMKLPQEQNIEVQVQQGTGVVFVNADVLAPHTLTSVDTDPAERPLFDTGGGDSTQPGETDVVEGVEQLGVGRYQFHCKVHSAAMQGWLNVVSSVVPRPAMKTSGGQS